ncbi:thiamine phosphate synthase [Pinibacter soli]|uniref:Thiamine-phosphate synthase n=1 Tax=Pinibacter soli TaxID=3044211 RepID=A0ABT6RCT1_9BACT|nr:thiamine phosphate synthase [Pinibacter soli]MDI3320388.1 thiamine phosphate synthase [Pinibacter soli]
MNNVFPYRLYLVISEDACNGQPLNKVAEMAILGGVDIIQLREKFDTSEVFLKKAMSLQEVLYKYNVPLIINDNLDVARRSKAYGIHVGNSDLPPTVIREGWPECQCLGYSIEYLKQLISKETLVSDYLGISPIFDTLTKRDTVTQWGLAGLRQIRGITDKPLVAIGNMNAQNAYDVMKAGADCLAVVSAICGAADPEKAAGEIRGNIERAL